MVVAGSRKRSMKGGFLDSLTSSLTDAWNKTKSAASGAYDSATGSTTGTSTYTPTYTPTSTTTSTYTPMGGRKRRRTRRMRGGNFTDNMPTTGLAAHAAPISGIPSAQAQMVGGRRTRRHRHRRSKSRRRR